MTRNQDFELDEEDSEDLLETMEQELLQRRFGPPVRLEVDRNIKPYLLNRLMEELEITENEVIHNQEPIDLTCLNQIADLDCKALKYPVFRGKTPSLFSRRRAKIVKHSLTPCVKTKFYCIILMILSRDL